MSESDSNMNPGYVPSRNGIPNNGGAPKQNNQNNRAGVIIPMEIVPRLLVMKLLFLKWLKQ